MLYFAYGSNMNHKQMLKRCPSSLFIKKAYLKNYKFVYDGHSRNRDGAVANIINSVENIVWGGLFEINSDNLAALDCYEGYPKSYDRRIIKVEDFDGKIDDAFVYIRNKPKEIGKPSEDYRTIIVEGANDCGVGDDYIKKNLLQ